MAISSKLEELLYFEVIATLRDVTKQNKTGIYDLTRNEKF